MICKSKQQPIDLASVYTAINNWLPEVCAAFGGIILHPWGQHIQVIGTIFSTTVMIICPSATIIYPFTTIVYPSTAVF